MCEITLKFYGVLAEIAGTGQTKLYDLHSVDELRSHVKSAYPGMEKHNFVFAVNNKLSQGNTVIGHGSTVAVMPPFSGG
jgi:molybdopterin converting factor small subunit